MRDTGLSREIVGSRGGQMMSLRGMVAGLVSGVEQNQIAWQIVTQSRFPTCLVC